MQVRQREYRPRLGAHRHIRDEGQRDCGLCLLCDGFSATSWVSKFDAFFEDLEDRRGSSESDTSSVVDSQLVEELECMLNEPSDCSDSEDELEVRLTEIRSHMEQSIHCRLERWEKEQEMEESIQYLVGELGAMNEQLRDMKRAFAQFRCEDAVAQAPELEYLHTVTITSDLMTQLEQDLLLTCFQ